MVVFGKVLLFVQKWFYSGTGGCSQVKCLYSGKIGFIRAKLLYSGKSGYIGQNGCFQQNWL